MSQGLELYNSRINRISREGDTTVIHFSVAFIYKAARAPGSVPGSEWSQEANLIFTNATISGSLPALPNTIADGFLEVGDIRYDMIPVPFSSKQRARIYLRFADNSAVEITGEKPRLDLIGTPVLLEEMA